MGGQHSAAATRAFARQELDVDPTSPRVDTCGVHPVELDDVKFDGGEEG